MARRIGILGGSFDPVHLGHLAMAREAVRRLSLDRLWFVPAKISPLKPHMMRVSDEDRLNMVRLAIRGEARMGVSDRELRSGGVSYTVDTLRRWKADCPDDELVFVAGMDSLLTLWRWKSPLELLSLCRFATFRRPGSAVTPRAEDLNLPLHRARMLIADIVDAPMLDISSSQVRELVAGGFDVRRFLPEAVARYVEVRGLYREGE